MPTMTAQHTPGPWRIGGGDTSPTNERSVVRGLNGDYVARVDPGRPEFAANARLIAAAPELLEALKGCEAVLAQSAPTAFAVTRDLTDAKLGKLWIAVTERARAAIAKAEPNADRH